MDYVYILVSGSEWEDMIVFLCQEDAIQESIKHPKNRVEIFTKKDTGGYIPTYNHYKNGKYIQK